MKRVFVLAALAILTTGSAWATTVTCSTAPKAQWKPQSALEMQLKAEGLNVRQIKAEKGCYEVYATDKDGKKVNLAYNAETFEKVANPEAGEN